MNLDYLKDKYLPLLREHFWVISLGVVGCGLIGYGLIYLLVTKSDSSEITFESGQTQTISQKKTSLKDILVDVEGAVQKPGVYKLSIESRVQDALLAAGGLSEKADHMRVSKSMNLAAKVVDGGKIYIPFEGDVYSGAGQESGASLFADASDLVNINAASESELDALSGVGPATAQKIISARPYSSIEELLIKKVVGKTVFEKIKDKVTVN